MKYLAIFAFILITGCFGEQRIVKNKSVKDSIDINGSTETIPDVMDIHPQPLSTTTTGNPITKTTSNPPTPNPNITTTSTTTPAPTNATTPTTLPTSSTEKPTTTTLKPNTTTTKPTTTTPITTTHAANSTTSAPSTTVKPIDPTTVAPEPHRRFDGPSFVGGIVLALGLVAIGFVAFKFYKARTESNYHTL